MRAATAACSGSWSRAPSSKTIAGETLTLFDTLFGIRGWKTSKDAVITDVTRMQGDKVCIAALDRGQAIRFHDPPPSGQWLSSIGGLTPGDTASVTLKPPRRYQRPHSEDRDWNPEDFVKSSRLSENDTVKRLSANAFTSIRDAFGRPCFYSGNGNAAFRPGRGPRSLASLIVSSVRPYPYEDGIRVDFREAKREWTMVPLEDLVVRNHQRHCHSCSSNLASLLASEFEGTHAVLRVGLGRPFRVGDNATGCFLQVNHIFLTPSKRKHFV